MAQSLAKNQTARGRTELRKIGGVDAWMNENTAETSSFLRSREGTQHQSVLDESIAISVCELAMLARGCPIFQSSNHPIFRSLGSGFCG